MAEERSRLTVWSFLKGLFKVVIGLSLLAQSLLFLMVLVVVIGIASSVSRDLAGEAEEGGPSIKVPSESALVINPAGVLVETTPPADPLSDAFAAALSMPVEGPVSLHDLVAVLRSAAEDDRINVVVLDLQGLFIPSGSASKAHYLADEVEKVRAAGKQVIAIGDYYTQEQYLVAAAADEILLHDFGMVAIEGYGAYNTYLAEALEKLKVTAHVFRVGTFKAAVEPFLRNDMSAEAKEANIAYLSDLWSAYADKVDARRDVTVSGGVKEYAAQFPALMRAAGNNAAKAALEAGLVDQLMDRPSQIAHIASIVGRDEKSELKGFRGVGYRTYRLSMPVSDPHDKDDKIAVVTVAGAIVDGDERSGAAGGDAVALELKRARTRKDVKAVVLRVDSPGGSVFASEVIRDEVLAVKAAGKPVIVSMGSLAASGGYWISANADEIWSSPVTITGSIGVFSFFPTFEESFAEIGISTDGVGTTPLTGIYATGVGPLPEAYGEIIQASVEEIYGRFLGLVAEGREMTPDGVDSIAQGRVWSGLDAQRLGLVDRLGTLDDALASAAEKAGLEDYAVIGLTRERTPFERFLEGLAGRDDGITGEADTLFAGTGASALDAGRVARRVVAEIRSLAGYNDPQGTYVRCLTCLPTE
ncbi:protease IV, a signal peptide peptidase [Parvularcula bermudensis HTCC2503]|uniref:Protease IV, a signal peptide peptidase n=1 Tax=Parvularcula bermudensis (strain ATCC BAA-594 / HTCC2503 / KCTC 12087) TaxID=314260 RepID=E0TG70_PARBH|nr:signal peptide peptidase SppA [Parvularcula bermudensis]ADM10641.1 protease IV, a signal peptide peptidase [Parvularcula bermudensis HTCC2503]